MTIEQLQALPDKELNALAAKLRGLKTFNFQGVKWLGITDAQGKTHGKHKLRDWTPATSRDQSGELLAYAAAQGASTEIFFAGRTQRSGFVKISGVAIKPFPIKVEGNDARAETIAFCAAMLAIQGERQ